jgi:hypothetical protein
MSVFRNFICAVCLFALLLNAVGTPLVALAKGERLTPHGHGHRPHGHAPKHQSPQIKPTLLVLLAEKYSPETLSDWKSTIVRHQQLRAEIVTLVKNKPRLQKTLQPIHREDLRLKFEADQTVRSTLQTALRDNDAAKIKSSLAELLKRLKQRNQVLSQKINALKAGRDH